MASSSNANILDGGGVSFNLQEDDCEEGMWKRIRQVERDFEAQEMTGSAGGERLPTPFGREMRQLGEQLQRLVEGESLTERLSCEILGRMSMFFSTISKCGNELDSRGFAQEIAEIFKALDSEAFLAIIEWLENLQADTTISSRKIFLFLNEFLVCDKRRKWESRFLKLFWRHSKSVSDTDLLFCLSKLVEYYSALHEVVSVEEFISTNDERAAFLTNCSNLDIAIRFTMDFKAVALHQPQEYGQKANFWAQRESMFHTMASTELVKPLTTIFPFSSRFETAKGCLDCLDQLKNIAVDLNPDKSDTLASILRSFMSPELQALNALKSEMELHQGVVLELEQLSAKHLNAYKTLTKDQHERLRDFFYTCQEEKRNVVQEALYKKVKCLASIKKASINSHVKMSSEDTLKGIVQKAGIAFKEVEGKLHEVLISEKVCNKECALCFSEFSKKRKRACLDPCGHASACIDCATQAWAKKPNCPWCNASIEKPFPVPAQMFF